MKKLDLKLDSIKEMLGKEQMKKITGGSSCYSGYCGSMPMSYWTCFDEYGDQPAGAVCSPYNPYPVGEGEIFVYNPANYPGAIDQTCRVTLCSF